jgi:hypothetical protein
MAIFNSYVELPEGNICHTTILWWHVTHVASGKV